MTALQDWLNISSDTRGIKELICDVIRGRTSDASAEVSQMTEPILMGRGRERC
jgi:hypothetical protein